MAGIEKNEYTKADFVKLFRFRVISAIVRSSAIKRLEGARVTSYFKNRKPSERYHYIFTEEWILIEHVLQKLGLDIPNAQDLDFVLEGLFSGTAAVHMEQEKKEVYFVLTKGQIKYFHNNCRMVKANVLERKAIGLKDDYEELDNLAF